MVIEITAAAFVSHMLYIQVSKHGRWGRLVMNQGADERWVTRKKLQRDNRSGAASEHDRRSVAELLEQAGCVVDISLQTMGVRVLIIDLATREPASVICHDPQVRRQTVRDPVVGVS
jgi:hypothetical protein